ncbi:uncharacterized protein LOC144468479 [Augochlora pura]
MSQKKILLRSALSCDVDDGPLDMDQIMDIAQNADPWDEIEDFVRCNFMQGILNEFNELITLDPQRKPPEYVKKPTAKKTRQKKEESSTEKTQSNSKTTGGKSKGKAEKSMKQKATKEKSIKEKSTKGKSTKEKSMQDKSTKDKSVKDKSTTEKSTAEKSTIEKSTKEKSTKDKSTKDKSTKEKSTKEKSTKEKSTKEQKCDKDLEKVEDASSCTEEAKKSAKDQKSQGNSLEAKVNSTVKRSGDRASIGSKMADPMHVTMEMEETKLMEPSQDTNVFSFDADTSPIEESTRIDYSTNYDREPVETSSNWILNGDHHIPFDATILSDLQEEQNGGRKSLNNSKREYMRKAERSAEKIVEEQILNNSEKFVEEMKKQKQCLRKSRCSKKENAEEIAETNSYISEKFDGKEKDKSLDCSKSKCSRKEANTEKHILNNRKSLEKSKCSKTENTENIVEKVASNNGENFDGKLKEKRKSSGCSKHDCSRGESNAEKQILDDRKELIEEKERKRRSLGKSKCSLKDNTENIMVENVSLLCSRRECSRKETNAEKQILDNREGLDEKTKEKRESLGKSGCVTEEKNVERTAERMTLQDCKKFDDEKKIGLLDRSKCAKEEMMSPAKRTVKKQISDDRKVFDEEKKARAKSLGSSNCMKKEKHAEAKDEKKTKKKRKPKARDQQVDASAAIKGEKLGRFERLLLRKQKRRKERKIRRHEREANQAIEEFGKQVVKIVKKMGYNIDDEMESNEDSDTSNDCSCCSSDYDSCSCSDSSCSCCSDYSCSCSDSCSCSSDSFYSGSCSDSSDSDSASDFYSCSYSSDSSCDK